MTDNEYAIFIEYNCAPIGRLIQCNLFFNQALLHFGRVNALYRHLARIEANWQNHEGESEWRTGFTGQNGVLELLLRGRYHAPRGFYSDHALVAIQST